MTHDYNDPDRNRGMEALRGPDPRDAELERIISSHKAYCKGYNAGRRKAQLEARTEIDDAISKAHDITFKAVNRCMDADNKMNQLRIERDDWMRQAKYETDVAQSAIEEAGRLREALVKAEAMLCEQEDALRRLGCHEPCSETTILTARAALSQEQER